LSISITVSTYEKPEDLMRENGLLRQLTKAFDGAGAGSRDGNASGLREARSGRQARREPPQRKKQENGEGDFGEIEIATPRDRDASFEPRIVGKDKTRMAGLDAKIVSLYARGMTTRDIQGHLEELYGVKVSATFISNVTDAVLEEVRAWQSRPLDAVYPIVYMDALVVKMREQGQGQNRAVYVAIGINMQAHKEVLGRWTSAQEGAKFWLSVLTELKNRGVEDIFIACVDGLKGFPEAIETAYPKTTVQLCIVHLVRARLRYVNWKEARAVIPDLK
jgi:putative transposase